MTNLKDWAKAQGPSEPTNGEDSPGKPYRVLCYDRKSHDRHKSTRTDMPDSIEARWEAIQAYCKELADSGLSLRQ